MVERVFSKKTEPKQHHQPHGLSREAGQGSAMPMILGLICAAAVMVVLWLAYTYA